MRLRKQNKITTDFVKNTGGNVAMMFAISTVGLLSVVGAAVDYSGMTKAKQELQGQVDASVLAAAGLKPVGNKKQVKDKDREQLVKDVLVENGYDLSYAQPIINIANPTISVNAKTQYKTAFMSLIGKSTVDIHANAQSQINAAGFVEIALVLDNTDSMGVNGKLDALKAGAKGLLTTLEVFPDDKINVGIVPFAKNVNVGTANRGASWLDMPDEYTITRPNEPTKTSNNDGDSGTCTTAPATGTRDGTTYTYDKRTCTGGTPTTYTTTYGPKDYTAEWKGCVGVRPSNLHVTDTTYSTRIPGLTYFEASERNSSGKDRRNYCPREIMPLTNDFSVLESRIDELFAVDSTYMPLGVAWGQRVLSPGAPFTQAQKGADIRKVMIVMTDGNNTVHIDTPPYLERNDSSTSIADEEQADKDTLIACENAKSADIEIFTIAFQVTDIATKTMLTTCATGNNNYYDAGDNAALIATFEKIGSRLNAVRLTQ